MGKGVFLVMTAEQEDAICASYRGGKTMEAVALEQGCSVGPIRRVLRAHAIAARTRRERSRMELIRGEVLALYKSGWSMTQIGKKLHACRNSLSALIGRSGARRPFSIRPCTFNVSRETDCALLAGLLLGEGSIVLWNDHPRIDITNTCREMIDWLLRLGGRAYRNRQRNDARIRSERVCYTWSLARASDVYRCLVWILPYLFGPKRQKAQASIRTLEVRHGFLPTEAMRESARRVQGDEPPDRWSRSA